MFLKKLTKRRLLSVSHHKNGLLQTSKGYVYKLDLPQQILFIRDKKQQIYAIHLSDIEEIS